MNQPSSRTDAPPSPSALALQRTRQGMADELARIRADIPTVPDADRAYLEELLGLVETIRACGEEGAA